MPAKETAVTRALLQRLACQRRAKFGTAGWRAVINFLVRINMIRQALIRRVIAAVSLLLAMAWWSSCQADIIRAPGISISKINGGKTICPGTEGNGINFPPDFVSDSYFRAECTLTAATGASGYVAKSGWYDLWIEVWINYTWDSSMGLMSNDKGSVNIDAKKSLSEQSLDANSGNTYAYKIQDHPVKLALCYYLYNPKTFDRYTIYKTPGVNNICTYNSPAPSPTPIPQEVTCQLNSGSPLDVDLGTLERATIPTVPGSGNIKTVQFPVTCTNGSANINMKLSYTPVTVSGTQVVSSSINGLGVAVSYNNKVLSPSDVTAMQLAEGSNNVTLKFEAVRNPSVAVSDIATGPFNAGAVLVMTQQ